MKRAFFSLALAAWLVPAARAQDVVGDWMGTLSAGGTELRLLVHIAKGAGSSLTGTMDSLDQGAMGIKISQISLDRATLKFSVDAVRGKYQGKLAGDAIKGTWNQGQPVELDLTRVKSSPLDGAWAGTLDFGATKLRLILHLTSGPQGLIASLQSPDQGDAVIPASSVKLDMSGLVFEAAQVGARFEGKLNASLGSISGTFTQGGRSAPLELKRVKDAAELRPPRPQNPSKPYPYREEEVRYPNWQANIRLAATLTIPEGQGPFPAVLLITGSGPQDRDETIAGHQPFLVLSDYLTRKGIAVLRADDRGIGKSGGNFRSATTADFATDAEAGVAFLKTRSEVNPKKIGLVGHSEGGTIAPMVAARNHDVAFIAMLAGTGVPGDDIIVEQLRLIAMADGATREQADKLAAQQRKVTTLVKSEPNLDVLTPKLRELLKDKPAVEINPLIAELTSAWYRFFLTFDPAGALAKVACPVLALNGEKDLQVPPGLNLPAIRKALEAGHNPNYGVVEMPGLNHMFQTARTGSPTEYGQIEETMAPKAMEMIGSWILKQ